MVHIRDFVIRICLAKMEDECGKKVSEQQTSRVTHEYLLSVSEHIVYEEHGKRSDHTDSEDGPTTVPHQPEIEGEEETIQHTESACETVDTIDEVDGIDDGNEHEERDGVTGKNTYLFDTEDTVQVCDSQVRKSDECDAGERFSQQLGCGGEDENVIDEADRHDGEETDEEELTLVQLVILKKEVGEHETEDDVESSDIRHISGMTHSLIRSHHEPFGLGDTQDNRHTNQTDKKADAADQVTVCDKEILYHCGSNCS